MFGAFFLLFPDGIPEVSQLSAQSEVFAVGVCHQTALLEIQLALAVEELFLNVDTGDLRFEHRVGAQFLGGGDAAFQTDGGTLRSGEP